MKKLFVIALTILCLMLSTAGVWAEADLSAKVEPELELQYEYVDEPTATLFVSSEGIASCRLSVPIKPDKTIDYGQVTAYLKKSTGITVKTFTDKIYPSAGKLSWQDTHKLTSRGNYCLIVEVKCYKGGKLVETVKDQSKSKTY